MPMKEWFRQMQPVQLYVILGLTIVFFLTELVMSHLTHALTLLMDSYHQLCNILALTGCIITIKYGKQTDQTEWDHKKSQSVTSLEGEELSSDPNACHDKMKKAKATPARVNQEKKLKNTFGWARIDVISMLICCIFMASLSFSIFVEALQTLVHIDHHDEMHHPISVLCIGCAGLLLNGVCYLLIGGYTFHQGSFLYVTESGDVILNKVVVSESVRRGERRLSRTRNIQPSPPPQRQRQGFKEMCRDILGCSMVIICALLVYFTEKDVAKYIDPLLSFLSATLILWFSYPYMKESCLILLQTIPDTINIDALKKELLQHFPDIVNVHDFHVWQLTATKVISTVHIIFQNPKVYNKIVNDVKDFFVENGITQVTIQPEFFSNKSISTESLKSLTSDKVLPTCLVACVGEGCKESACCPTYKQNTNKIKSSKEELPVSNNSPVDLKSIKTINPETSAVMTSMNTSASLDNVCQKNELNTLKNNQKDMKMLSSSSPSIINQE